MKCGCHGTVNAPTVVTFCPLHAAAPELVALLRELEGTVGYTVVKPAGGRRNFQAAAVPTAAWERIIGLCRRAVVEATP